MIERSTATPAQYAPWRVPPQRAIGDRPSIVELKTPEDVAAATRKGLALIGNISTYAIGANAFNREVPGLIRDAKGPKRGLRQPLGLTVPFDNPHIQGTFDLKRLGKNIALCKALESEELTKILGALAFVRVPADLEAVDRNELPEYVTSEPKQDPCLGEVQHIQVWSPEGNEPASEIIQAMLDEEQLPLMTSANISGEQHEIVTTGEAIKFARAKDLPISIDMPDSERGPFLGSYSIFTAREEGLELTRAGFVHHTVWRDILGDLLIPGPFPEHSYPDNVLRNEHLPNEAKHTTGEAKRNFVLDKLLKRA